MSLSAQGLANYLADRSIYPLLRGPERLGGRRGRQQREQLETFCSEINLLAHHLRAGIPVLLPKCDIIQQRLLKILSKPFSADLQSRLRIAQATLRDALEKNLEMCLQLPEDPLEAFSQPVFLPESFSRADKDFSITRLMAHLIYLMASLDLPHIQKRHLPLPQVPV